MNPDELEPSPFAAFAAPKRSAVEEFQERHRRSVEARRKMIACVLAAIVGTTMGATACAGFNLDFEPLLTILVAAHIGSIGGAVLGLIVGSICFAALSVAGMRTRSIGNEFVRRDPMGALRGLMFAWSLMGTALGSSAGARVGSAWANVNLAAEPLGRWTMFGAVAGGFLALAVWFLTVRQPQSDS